MYYNPESYNVLPYYHNYTESGDWEYTSFFIPSFAAFYREGYVDNRGVCNMEKAKAFYEEERRKLESTPKALIDYRAEYCFNAEEAFALEGTNNFNKVKLVEQLAAIKFKKNFVPKIERGWMEFTYRDGSRKRDSISGVRFKPDPNGPVHIIQHPLWKSSNDINPGETAEEYAERKKLDQETISSVINNLYVAGIDGIDMGQEQTSEATKDPSQFCTLIKRRVYGMKEPTYVAYYLDRPQNIEQAYAQTVGLLYYYNCRVNLEATRLSILGWAKKEKWIQYFMRRPRICSGDPTKKRSFNTPYGTPASTAMITHGLDLVANYIEEYCHNIWFPELIDQLMKYTDEKKRKFDLVAAMQMTEIGDEELNDLNPVSAKPVNSEFQDIGYYKDEKGYTRFGVIPKRTQMNVKASWDNYDGKNVTSDPRYR